MTWGVPCSFDSLLLSPFFLLVCALPSLWLGAAALFPHLPHLLPFPNLGDVDIDDDDSA